MQSRMKWLIVLTALIIMAALVLVFIPGPQTANAPTDHQQQATTTAYADLIEVHMIANAHVASPLTVSGRARGTWYFEASAPVELFVGSTSIAQGHLQAQGDWMTTDYVPFVALLTFPPQPSGTHGMLVLKNDNPSGDPAKQKELDIPVQF